MDGSQASLSSEPAAESGCGVDWSWLEGREIAKAVSELDSLVITFRDGQTLTIRASIWKGQAFLAFDPWKASS